MQNNVEFFHYGNDQETFEKFNQLFQFKLKRGIKLTYKRVAVLKANMAKKKEREKKKKGETDDELEIKVKKIVKIPTEKFGDCWGGGGELP